MDLSQIKQSGRPVHIKHPVSGDPIGLTLQILPASDERVKAAKRRQLNHRLQSRKQKITAEQLEASAVELLCAAIVGWEWTKDAAGEEATFGGEKPEFNEINLRKVLTVLDWVREQADEELGDDAAFFRRAD